MKKLSLLSAGILYACVLPAQPSFQTSLQAGISLPLNSNEINATHAGKAIHFGNHLDYTFGGSNVRFGLGAYIGYLNSLSADNKYKETGEAIAEKYRFNTALLTFNASSFKSTHILIGPVASFGSAAFNVNIWAKGGYGLNEPSRYAVLYKENGVSNNIYLNQGGENKNGLAYSAGAGVKLAISEYVGLQLSAGYFSTQTDQVNYNFDREKGTTPLYYTASNQFIQASAGLQFTIGNPGKKNAVGVRSRYTDVDTNPLINARPDQKIKTKSNIKNDRVINPGEGDPQTARMDQKIKTKSNIKNDRMASPDGDDNTDSLLFSPQKIELRARIASAAISRVQLQSVDNYLTGFLYKTPTGTTLNQCGSSAMDGEPIPGIDVRLKRIGSTGNDMLSARTNKDGSFAFNNAVPGNYTAEAGTDKMDVTVNGNNENVFRPLDMMGGSCSDIKENYIITAGDKTYVEVTAGRKQVANIKWSELSTPRDAASGLATGKRMHKPYLTSNMEFDINQSNIVTSDGKLYAEVVNAREAGTGMATGRRMIVTGDVDGDGFDDNAIVSPRDAASGLATGKRMHKPYVITTELDLTENEILSPRDAASGLSTGRRMHKPFVVTIDADEDGQEIVSPRDVASGLPTGKRMHKPYVISIDQDEDTYEVISPRDVASGQSTGKRMHKPFVITKELDYTAAGDEITTYKIVHRDIAARNILLNEKGIITGKDNDNGMFTNDDAAAVVHNPLYQPSGGSSSNPLAESKNRMMGGNGPTANAITDNPLYQESGSTGVNPLFEAKTDLRVMGSNGIAHDIFIPSNITVVPVNDPPTEYTTYNVGPIRWMAPESIGNGSAGKSINTKGIKRSEAAAKGITEKGMKMTPDKMEANSERKGWDGSVKGSGKNINTSEDNLGSGKMDITGTDGSTARKGWDGVLKGGARVKDISRVRCAGGTCSVEATVELDGVVYEAVISGVLKTKHDTVKNSIGNIR